MGRYIPHHIGDDGAEAAALRAAEVLEDVAAVVAQQPETDGDVVLLQHRLLVVELGQRRV